MTSASVPGWDNAPWPEGNEAARVIVCERRGWWAVALRRHLPPWAKVSETRSLTHCWQTLAETPAAFVVVELSGGNAPSLLDGLARLERDFPAARVAVVAPRRMAAWEWLVREAGAVHFVTSPRAVPDLARLAARHLKQVPSPERSLEETIWARLPWRR